MNINNLPPINQNPNIPPAPEPDYFAGSNANDVHVRDYWKVVVKRRVLFMAVFFTSILIGCYVTFTASKLYSAISVIKIEPQNPAVTGINEFVRVDALGSGKFDYYETQFKLLESRSLAAKVIKELKLDSDKSFGELSITNSNFIARTKSWLFGWLNNIFSRFVASEQPSFQTNSNQRDNSINESKSPKVDLYTSLQEGLDVRSSVVNHYGSFLRVNPVKNTRLVEIKFTTPDPSLSQILANAHARGFVRFNLETRNELTQEARQFLDAKHEELRAKLERSEEALNRFRQEHGVVSMERGENIVVERLVDLNRQLTGAKTQRIEAESLYRTVANKPAQYLSQVMTQGLIPNLRTGLQTLEAEKVRLSAIFKAEHPRLIELNQQIAETKRALATEISNVVRGIEESFLAARAKEQSLQAEADKQQQRALTLKEIGVQYAVLEQDVKVNRTLYDSVLKRLNETNVANDIAASNIQIIQRAEKPRYPSSPDVPFNIIASMFIGLILGTGVVFIFEYFDTTVGTPQQVWSKLTLDTIGVVPNFQAIRHDEIVGIKSSKPLINWITHMRLPTSTVSASKELMVAHHPFSVVAESYRAIRTSLLFNNTERPPQIILLTSPIPGDGKTVTTLNLGIALAQDGHNVLVMDGDMRKDQAGTTG